MNLVHPPLILKKLFPNYIWNIRTEAKILYLTFDDGPTPKITGLVLDVLKKYNAKATFFCIGKNVKKYPEIFTRILNEGHSVGNHTYHHLKGWKTLTKNYINDIRSAEETIQQINKSTNQQRLFRPPYGQIRPAQAKSLQKLGYKIVMWDVLSYDWDAKISKEKVYKNCIENTGPGSIIVFHDSVKAAENMSYALEKTVNYFSKKGYLFKGLDSI